MLYRITKFDPKKRNDKGHYLDLSEWTAISDIGKSEYNNVTYAEYEKVETAYTEAIRLILEEKNILYLQIDALESRLSLRDIEIYKIEEQLRNISIDYNSDIANLANGTILNSAQIEKTIRLILREIIWMNLCHDDFEISFGYDYYMFVDCSFLASSTIHKIYKLGLFVEVIKPNDD
jgi:SepF-like predicted cell division protein (DUF552 family)